MINLVAAKDGGLPFQLPENCIGTELDPFIHCNSSKQLPSEIREGLSMWFTPDSTLQGFRNSKSTRGTRSHVKSLGELNTPIWRFTWQTSQFKVRAGLEPQKDFPADRHDQLIWWTKKNRGRLPLTGTSFFDMLIHHIQTCDNVQYLASKLEAKDRKSLALREIFIFGR